MKLRLRFAYASAVCFGLALLSKAYPPVGAAQVTSATSENGRPRLVRAVAPAAVTAPPAAQALARLPITPTSR